MAGKASLFAVSAPSSLEDDEDDFSDDALPSLDEVEDDPGAGPFDAYAETVLDADAPIEERKDALRECILTLLEERGGR
jgi:hypothetical protein